MIKFTDYHIARGLKEIIGKDDKKLATKTGI